MHFRLRPTDRQTDTDIVVPYESGFDPKNKTSPFSTVMG